jgi:urease accessory protein
VALPVIPTAMPMPIPETQALQRLLQLVSPTLPVGAYSYSEGLETLVQQGKLTTPAAVTQWLEQELQWGLVRLDAVAMMKVGGAIANSDYRAFTALNRYLSALRDTEESRQQSWAMGRALNRMATQLEPDLKPWIESLDTPCNFAVSFGLLATHWHIAPQTMVLGYLQSWATNLIAAAIKLVPLGQTMGQKILLDLTPALDATARHCQEADLETMTLSSWGTSLASMQHETLYSRLFRS